MPDISKVILNGVTQMDVTQDTVAPGNLLLNETATMSNGTRTVGTVSLEQYALKALLATEEATSTASKWYYVGDYLIYNNDLCVVTADISSGGTISSSNTETVLLANELRNAFMALQRSLGADAYEPTGYASVAYANGWVVLCGGPDAGLYQVYDLSIGDYIPSGVEVVSTDIMYMLRNRVEYTDLANAVAKEIIKVSFSLTGTGASVTASKSNAKITADHELIGYALGTPSAQVGNLTVTTSTGAVSVSGAVNGSTTLTIYLGLIGTSVT